MFDHCDMKSRWSKQTEEILFLFPQLSSWRQYMDFYQDTTSLNIVFYLLHTVSECASNSKKSKNIFIQNASHTKQTPQVVFLGGPLARRYLMFLKGSPYSGSPSPHNLPHPMFAHIIFLIYIWIGVFLDFHGIYALPATSQLLGVVK